VRTREDFVERNDHGGTMGTWTPSQLPPDRVLLEPASRFKRQGKDLIDEESAQLGERPPAAQRKPG
jgi:hypothetical protein